MRLLALAAFTAAVLTAGTAAAQDPSKDGEYRAALTRMITETAQGTCPADVMADGLHQACEEQIGRMASMFQTLGDMTSMNLVAVEGEGAARVETYEVTYEAGQTLSWSIGGRQADGKFAQAGAGAPR